MILCRYLYFSSENQRHWLYFQCCRGLTKHWYRMSRRRIFFPEKVTFSDKIKKKSVREISGIFFSIFRIKKHCLYCKKHALFFPKIIALMWNITSFLFLSKMSTSIFWTKPSIIDQNRLPYICKNVQLQTKKTTSFF